MDASFFSDIIGHKKIKEQLYHLIQADRMPHAMIFAGPSGLGKTRMAQAVASAMIGRPALVNWEAYRGSEVIADRDEVYLLVPKEKSILQVNQFRQLQEKLMMMGRSGSKRICIIDKVETMNKSFANSMLKTLEEPPRNVCFILITNQPDLLLPTIISRCTMVLFDPVNDDEMREGLVKKLGGQPQQYDNPVLWGCGNVRTALDLCEGTGMGGAERALEFLKIMSTHACPYAKWQTVAGGYKEAIAVDLLRWTSMFLRDMLVLRAGASKEQLRLKQYEKDLLALLPYWPDAGIFQAMQVIEEGNEAILRHVNMRLIWDYLCIQFQHAKGGI